ncbi:MAG: acetyl-CoA carboxylase carboxyltransferase subunit alpha [Armatimonadetes bacterium]|nr:acetyl-CoA carboxylase carboxyltransferase subunit alpha [Armatimonadota bacterium]
MPENILEFEQPIAQLEAQIAEIKRLTAVEGVDRGEEIALLEAQVEQLRLKILGDLTAWDHTQIARHPKRPYALDFIRLMCDDFLELHGDRLAGDDGAMVGGIARIGEQQLVVTGQQKGRDIHERQRRNFGSARPEGYRKALRLMRLAEKFGRPVVCLVDTPAADCSVAAEEHGICEAIAHNMRDMFLLTVPIIVAVIGEGGSGGAIGIGVGDRILMLEHAIYSIIPPEGCAAILWKDPKRGPEAADQLRLTAQHALAFGVVDEIVPEPLGGAHRDVDATARALKDAVCRHLDELSAIPVEQLLRQRYERFRRLGPVLDPRAAGQAACDGRVDGDGAEPAR